MKLFNRTKRLIKTSLLKLILRFKKFDITNSIIIFSEARGGSTWLMELLSKLPRTCINWEPLHTKKGVVPSGYKFGTRPFISPDDKNIIYYSIFKKIFTYQIYNNWTIKYLSIFSLIKSKYVITKFVRGNLLTPYILNNFNFKTPPIVLLRHPIDTCQSQLKAFDNKDINAKTVKIPDCINNERYVRHIDFINELETKLEKKIAMWCLNNCPLIEQLDQLNVHIIYYSDLVLNPHMELKKLFDSYNFAEDFDNINSLNLRKASKTDFNDELKVDPEEQLNKNFNKLDSYTKQKIQKIFDHFDLNLYSAYSPIPQK